MNIQKELHKLVEEVDCDTAKQELHTEVDELSEQQARQALTRMRRWDVRYILKKLGFYL